MQDCVVGNVIFFDGQFLHLACDVFLMMAVLLGGGVAGRGGWEQMVKNSQGLFQESLAFPAHIPT